MAVYHIIKIKGTARIPDYVQLRDSKYTLIAYFRLDRPEKALTKCGLESHFGYIIEVANNLPFGEVKQFEI